MLVEPILSQLNPINSLQTYFRNNSFNKSSQNTTDLAGAPTPPSQVVVRAIFLTFFKTEICNFGRFVSYPVVLLRNPCKLSTFRNRVRCRDGVVGIATRYRLEGPGIESRWGDVFRIYPDRLRGPPSLLYNGYRVFPGVKAAGAWR